MNRSLKNAWLVAALLVSTFTIVKAQEAVTGIRAIEVEQFEKAKRIFSALIQANPSNADNYFYLGKAYYKQDKIDSAKYYFQQGLAANPNSTLNIVGLGSVDYDLGNVTEAKANFEKAIGISLGKDFQTYISIGEVYRELGVRNFDEALNNFLKAKAINPKSPELLVAIGDVYMEQANGSEAVKYYTEALKLNPNYVNAHVRTGKLWTRSLNYAEAKIAFDKAIKIDSTFAPIYREYGELELGAKHFESAVEKYKKYLALTDKSLNSQLRYAKFLFYGKQFQESIDIIKQIVAKDSSDYINYRLLGYSSYEIKDYKAGLTAMNKFFSMNPAKILPQDYAYLGKLQVKNKLDSMGVNTILRAIALDTTSRDLYGDLSDAYFSMKKYKLSAETYELKLLNTKPTAVDYFNLGRKYYFGLEFAKSDSAFAKLLALNAEYKPAYLFRARNNVQIDNVDKVNDGLAKPFYEKFIELTTTDPKLDLKKSGKDLIEAYKYLGDYNYTVLKDYNAAILNFQKVVEIDPNDKDAKLNIEGLMKESKK